MVHAQKRNIEGCDRAGGGIAVLKWIIAVDLTWKVSFEQAHEGNCEVSIVEICGESASIPQTKEAAKCLRWELVYCVREQKGSQCGWSRVSKGCGR